MKYEKIYNQIIKRAKTRKLEDYSETHHIIPKCMGGEDNSKNLVKLTAKEHFLVHKLLCEIYPDNHKLLWALWMMAIGKKKWKHRDPYQITSRDYERIRLKVSEARKGTKLPENVKKKIGKKNSKPVYQFSMNGEYIQSFNSANDAERFILNKPNAHWKELGNNINDCCRLRQKSAYGFIWKYDPFALNLEQHKGSLNKRNGDNNKRT